MAQLPTTLYLSGPMTGQKDLNFPAFNAAALLLRNAGFTVINPAEIEQPKPECWLSCMWTDIEAMAKARVEGIATLPDWDRSRGARCETTLAFNLQLPVFSVGQWLQAKEAS